MKKYVFFCILLVSYLFAKSVEINIVSDDFKSDENKHLSVFSGNVKIVKQNDKILANLVQVSFDKDNKPLVYEARGSVNFTISLKDSVVSGQCEKLVYKPLGKIYTLINKVDIVEFPSNRKLKANKVTIDTINGKILVNGNKKKPIKFIFNVEE